MSENTTIETSEPARPAEPVYRCEVLKPLIHDGVPYVVGNRIDLNEERAMTLGQSGIVRPLPPGE